jgi:putative membrane protein
MNVEILVRYVHFISIFLVVASLVVEHALVKERMSGKELRRFMNYDAVYGIGALLVVAMGLLLWFSVGKPAEFYTKNWLMHLKLGLFVIVGLISIVPSVRMSKLKKRTGPNEIADIPKSIIMIIRMELLIVFLLPLIASLMAKGIGYFG